MRTNITNSKVVNYRRIRHLKICREISASASPFQHTSLFYTPVINAFQHIWIAEPCGSLAKTDGQRVSKAS